MTGLSVALAVLVGFAFGVLIGAVAWSIFLVAQLNKPEKAKEFIRAMYAKTHGHWLQKSKDDATPVCPCCGWSPDRVEREQAGEAS